MSDKRMLALLKKRKEELSAPSKPISLAAKPEVSRNEAKSIAPADKKARSSSNNGNDAVAKPLPSLSTVSSAAKRPAGSGQDAAAVPAGRNDKKRPAVGTVKAPVAENANAAARTRDITSATPPLKKGGLTALQAQMENKLQGAQFRWLNEKLYTTTSEEAMDLMSSDPSLFEAYHEGFRHQVTKWPINPVDIFVRFLKAHPAYVVGDFGCGDAKIARSVTNRVHSFDLVSVNDYVTACDIRRVPVDSQSLDVAIFSLALMGTNLADFLREAHRTLKKGGHLKIAEVRSRFDEQHNGIPRFIEAITELGFRHKHTDTSNTHFVLLDFVKSSDVGVPRTASGFAAGPLLKPCIYKRR